jgi:hypothetical protein
MDPKGKILIWLKGSDITGPHDTSHLETKLSEITEDDHGLLIEKKTDEGVTFFKKRYPWHSIEGWEWSKNQETP